MMVELTIGIETAIVVAVVYACTSNICDRLDALTYELRYALHKQPKQDDIIRCKDCYKHRKSGLCEGWSRYGTITTKDDDFCSKAERIKS